MLSQGLPEQLGVAVRGEPRGPLSSPRNGSFAASSRWIEASRHAAAADAGSGGAAWSTSVQISDTDPAAVVDELDQPPLDRPVHDRTRRDLPEPGRSGRGVGTRDDAVLVGVAVQPGDDVGEPVQQRPDLGAAQARQVRRRPGPPRRRSPCRFQRVQPVVRRQITRRSSLPVRTARRAASRWLECTSASRPAAMPPAPRRGSRRRSRRVRRVEDQIADAGHAVVRVVDGAPLEVLRREPVAGGGAAGPQVRLDELAAREQPRGPHPPATVPGRPAEQRCRVPDEGPDARLAPRSKPGGRAVGFAVAHGQTRGRGRRKTHALHQGLVVAEARQPRDAEPGGGEGLGGVAKQPRDTREIPTALRTGRTVPSGCQKVESSQPAAWKPSKSGPPASAATLPPSMRFRNHCSSFHCGCRRRRPW